MKTLFLHSCALLLSFIFSYKINAQQQCWTAISTDGTVDEADINIVDLNSYIARVKAETLAGSVEIRYNIVATNGLFGGECDYKTVTARYIDNGSSAQVIIRVYTFNITTGSSSTLAEFNSNNFLQTNTVQVRSFSFGGNFNFATNAYYIEVQLSKTNTNGNPQIRALKICAAGVCFEGMNSFEGMNTSASMDNLNSEAASLEQNAPNPFNKTTTIRYNLPGKFASARIAIADNNGKILKLQNITTIGKGTVNIDAGALSSGTYNYSLIVDGRVISSKQMVLTK